MKTYQSIMAHIERLQTEAEALKREERKGVISRIQEAIEVYDISPHELTPKVARKAKIKAKATTIDRVRGPQPVMYEHPHTGQTWSGRGPQPEWLKTLLTDADNHLSDFEIGGKS